MTTNREDMANPESLRFRQTSVEILNDYFINLNERNKDNLRSLSTCSGAFKDKRLFEYILLMCEELGLDLPVAYHAVVLLRRFMVKHVTHLLRGAREAEASAREDAAFKKIRDNFALMVLSCVQLASKLSLQSQIVEINKAVRFLRSVGLNFSKEDVLKSELMVLNGLQFQLDPPNPLTYVEVLLEVLGHNESSAPVERLHHICCHVLRFVSLQHDAVYDALLAVTTQSPHPTAEQREKFMPVTEDCMLLGVGVIAAGAFILHVRDWQQVVQELSHITGISTTSIRSFAQVTLALLTGTPSDV
ncbi:cyclin N-terminal domain-containing protein 1 [Syngnathus scovelli]|uniref:cyclin N-terminal domain-containing protein 1 n=1 Tax=Syngnathus scovelli TaxID=161590 RepID=UPI00210F9EBB|nr:cyclin N-terminal domain-containing protein 1 [Syngnathus scovelli]